MRHSRSLAAALALALACAGSPAIMARADEAAPTASPQMVTQTEQESATTDAAANQQEQPAAEADATPSDGAAPSATTNNDEAAQASGQSGTVETQAATPQVTYRTHVQNIGWMDWVADGAEAGTDHRSLRVEALELKLSGIEGGIEYRAHVQNIGWQDWVSDGAEAGTDHRALRVEALEIRLTGAAAQTYDVQYRAHVQNIGWMDWVSDGEMAGTTGRCLQVEAIEVRLVKRQNPTDPGKTGNSGNDNSGSQTDDNKSQQITGPAVLGQAHVQSIGWMDAVTDGETVGTTGRNLHLEALKLSLANVDGQIQYSGRVIGQGWQDWVSDGAEAGTDHQNRALGALRVRLSGKAADTYDVWYRAHVANIGWMAWTKDGATAGTDDLSLAVEAVQVKLVPKGSAAPSNADAAVSYSAVETPSLTYRANVGTQGWQGWVQNGAIAGTTGQAQPVTQLAASFSNDAGALSIQYSVSTDGTHWGSWLSDGQATAAAGSIKAVRMRIAGKVGPCYDVWYRVHVSNIGWLGWTKNGNDAGTSIPADRIEAIQVVVELAGDKAPGPTLRAYAQGGSLNGIDIASYQRGIDLSAVNADFVIIKATQGTTYTNPYYKAWADNALANGKLVGFYHYASGGNPTAEADHFYQAIKGYKGRALVALDWEGVQNQSFRKGNDAVWCKAFMDRIGSLMGATPVLYISKNITRAVNWTPVARSYPLWAAQYANTKLTGYKSSPWTDSYSFGAWNDAKIYQYTSSGRINGWGGNLDLDIFYGNEADWRALQ